MLSDCFGPYNATHFTRLRYARGVRTTLARGELRARSEAADEDEPLVRPLLEGVRLRPAIGVAAARSTAAAPTVEPSAGLMLRACNAFSRALLSHAWLLHLEW